MKKTCFNALYAVICMGLAFVASACGSKAESLDDLTKLGASDDLVLVTGHASEIMRNAACRATAQGIELSPALTKIMEQGVSSARESRELENGLKLRGVDYDNCFFKVSADNSYVFAFGLTDADAFRSWMTEDMEMDSPVLEEGYEVYNLDSQVKLFASDDAAILIFRRRGECDMEYLHQIKEAAASNPLASWQVDALTQHKTCVVLFNARKCMESFPEQAIRQMCGSAYDNIEAIRKGFIEIDAELKGMKLHVVFKLLDLDGKPINTGLKFPAVDMKVFDYINKSDIMALALNLGSDIDWNQLLEAFDSQMGGDLTRGSNKFIADKIVEVLSNIDGTVFVSAHPKDMMRMSQGAQYWNGTIGAMMKKGAAQKYINEIKALAAQYGIHSTEQDGATVFSLPPFTIYLKDVDGMLVISTQPITGEGGSILVQSYFKGQPAAAEATLARGTDFGAGPLPFQPVIALSSNGREAAFDIELIGDGQYLLDAIFSFIASNIR